MDLKKNPSRIKKITAEVHQALIYCWTDCNNCVKRSETCWSSSCLGSARQPDASMVIDCDPWMSQLPYRCIAFLSSRQYVNIVCEVHLNNTKLLLLTFCCSSAKLSGAQRFRFRRIQLSCTALCSVRSITKGVWLASRYINLCCRMMHTVNEPFSLYTRVPENLVLFIKTKWKSTAKSQLPGNQRTLHYPHDHSGPLEKSLSGYLAVL